MAFTLPWTKENGTYFPDAYVRIATIAVHTPLEIDHSEYIIQVVVELYQSQETRDLAKGAEVTFPVQTFPWNPVSNPNMHSYAYDLIKGLLVQNEAGEYVPFFNNPVDII